MPEREGETAQAAGAPDAAGTLGSTVRRVAQALRDAGIAEPLAEARRLLVQAGACAALDLVTRPELPVDTAMRERIERWTTRRAGHEPLSRIAGEREFFGRIFALSPGTLDPRADTEILIEMTLDLIRDGELAGRPLRLLDAGTGTGAIAVTLLAEVPRATAVAIDISDDALATARANAARHGVADRLRALHCDMADGDRLGAFGLFDLIVSNPPYVASAAVEAFPPEYRAEPKLAHLGGTDGMDLVRRILAAAGRHLEPGGTLVMEIGTGREVIEHDFPDLPLIWLDTEESEGEVLLVTADDLASLDGGQRRPQRGTHRPRKGA